MSEIIRYGVTKRWSDAVIHNGVVYFVEVPDDLKLDARGQFVQVLEQIQRRLLEIGSNTTRILQTTIYLPDSNDLSLFNELWDAWLPEGHAPSRACIHAKLAAPGYRVELVVVAAISQERT